MSKDGNGWTRGVRHPAAAIVGAALVLSIGVGSAQGHKVTFDSNLQLKIDTLTATQSQYSGKINSTRAACEVGRAVSVTANGVAIATTTSVAGGAWSISGPAQAKGTTVIATIPRKILARNKKHKHKCRPASAQRRAH